MIVFLLAGEFFEVLEVVLKSAIYSHLMQNSRRVNFHCCGCNMQEKTLKHM